MNKGKLRNLTDGLLHRNPILVSGMIAAPVIACTDTLQKSFLLCYAFDAITFLTVLLSKAIPQRMPFAMRILSYSLIAALVYIPTVLAAGYLFPFVSIGIYFPLLTVSLMLSSETEHRYERAHILSLTGTVFFDLLGFDLVVLLMGSLRELLGNGTLHGKELLTVSALPSAAKPAMGMILLGCLAAMLRAVYPNERKEQESNAARH